MTTGTYITVAGLQIPTVEDLLALVVGDERSLIDPNVDTDPDSPIGQLNGIFCSHLEEAWEVLLIAYNGFNPDAAEGFLLDAASALTGTTREPATRSVFKLKRQIKINLNAATTVPGLDGASPPGGTVFSQLGNPSVRFDLLNSITSAGSGDYFVDAICESLGPVPCNAGTLTVIATPVVGLNSVTNPEDANLGLAQDTDPALRLRRESEIRASGSATLDALTSAILQITLDDGSQPILTCQVLQNVTMLTDANGLPPKSLEAIIFDGLIPDCPDTLLAQTIWNHAPGGIQLNGLDTALAVDSQGNNQVVNFTRPIIVQVKFALGIIYNAATYTGDAAVKAVIAAKFITVVKPGGMVRFVDYIQAIKDNVAGVIDIPSFQIALVGNAFPSPFVNLQLVIRTQGEADTSNMTVASAPGAP